MTVCFMPECQTSAGCQCNRGRITFSPRGCICPPGSEKTCQGALCPRRAFDMTPMPPNDAIEALTWWRGPEA